jgi:hypothetical protein
LRNIRRTFALWALIASSTPTRFGHRRPGPRRRGVTRCSPPAGSIWTNLWGISVAGDEVWAVGTFLDPATGNQDSLVLRGQGSTWTVSNAPNPGSGSNLLAGVAAVGNQV